MPRTERKTVRDVRIGIVDAAARLLREKGASAVTTRAVAEAAGVQAPTIYRLFGDKDGLIDAVAEQVMATYVAAKSGLAGEGVAEGVAEGAADPLEDLRSGWRMHVDFGLANPELFALLHDHRRSEPSPATAAGIEVLRARVRRLAAAGLLCVDERRAVQMVHAAGTGTILALLDAAPDDRDLALSDAMLDAVTHQILAATQAPPATQASAVAVTFATLVPDLPALTDAERALLTEWLDRSITALPGSAD